MLVYFLLILMETSAAFSVESDSGALSVYAPNDGWNSGELACGGRFRRGQEHIAYRGWRRVGCNRRVVVCADATWRCVLTTVRDAGPFGIYTGPLRNAVPEGRWRVFTGPGRPPRGWRYRAVADLSYALWRRLGRPGGLTRVRLFFLPRDGGRAAAAVDWLFSLERSARRALRPTGPVL